MNKFTGTAIDIYNSSIEYEYPKLEENVKKVRLDFDFIFTKEGVWYYMSSCNGPNLFTDNHHSLHKPVEDSNEKWKVVNSITGEIINEN